MRIRLRRWCWAMALTTITALCCNSRTQADSVLAGYDLFTSVSPGTNFGGVDFQGVPLGSFDFGGAIGVRATGTTDTIVQRVNDVTAPAGGSGTTRLEMVALQLVSALPVDFGLGLGFYYITLQSIRGGPSSTGDMTINFANPTPGPPPPDQPVGGTFASTINVAFDVRFGALDGPIVPNLSDTLALSQQGAFWSHYPAPGTLLIDGVNSNLNGKDHTFDFFPIGTVVETHPNGAMHSVIATGSGTIPEPSSIIMGGIAVMFGMGMAWRRRWAAA